MRIHNNIKNNIICILLFFLWCFISFSFIFLQEMKEVQNLIKQKQEEFKQIRKKINEENKKHLLKEKIIKKIKENLFTLDKLKNRDFYMIIVRDYNYKIRIEEIEKFFDKVNLRKLKYFLRHMGNENKSKKEIEIYLLEENGNYKKRDDISISDLIKKQEKDPNIQIIRLYFTYQIDNIKLAREIKRQYNKYNIKFLAQNYHNLFAYLYEVDYKYWNKEILIMKLWEYKHLFQDIEKEFLLKKILEE